MEITNKQIEALLSGDKVVTVGSKEEMALINLLVDSGLGNDVVKEHFATGVFVWFLQSKVNAINSAVEFLKSKGVTVNESSSTSPFTNYYSNTHYYIAKNDLINVDYAVQFVANKLNIPEGGKVDILDIRPL